MGSNLSFVKDGDQTFGEQIISLLERYGVTDVFGIPGSHNLELYRGFASSSIKHHLARHEQGAAFMADGFARVSGSPGVCFLITGPGLTNALTALGQARSDSVPILAISTVNPVSDQGRELGYLHELPDQRQTTAQFTAFSQTIRSPQQFETALARAFTTFNCIRPMPVHLEIPTDLLKTRCGPLQNPPSLPGKPQPDPQKIVEAAEILNQAQSPLIAVGGGASHASDVLKEISERIAAPVLSTTAGLGVVPSSFKNYAGACLGYEDGNRLLSKADAILAVGTQLASGEGPVADVLDFEAKLVRVDISLQNLTNRILADVSVWSDADLACRALLPLLSKSDPERRKSAKLSAEESRNSFSERLSSKQRAHMLLFDDLQESVGPDAIFFTDMTQLAYTARTYAQVEKPRSFFHPKGYETLGYALPAALGASAALSKRTIVAIAGDYGSMFTIQEMALCNDSDVKVFFVVWNNCALAEIDQGFDNASVKFVSRGRFTPRFEKIAVSMDWNYDLVSSREDLQEAATRFHTSQQSTLVEVREGSYNR